MWLLLVNSTLQGKNVDTWAEVEEAIDQLNNETFTDVILALEELSDGTPSLRAVGGNRLYVTFYDPEKLDYMLLDISQTEETSVYSKMDNITIEARPYYFVDKVLTKQVFKYSFENQARPLDVEWLSSGDYDPYVWGKRAL